MDLYRWLPPDAVKIVLVLFLSFLIGLEREERKTVAGSYSFGGVRTSPSSDSLAIPSLFSPARNYSP